VETRVGLSRELSRKQAAIAGVMASLDENRREFSSILFLKPSFPRDRRYGGSEAVFNNPPLRGSIIRRCGHFPRWPPIRSASRWVLRDGDLNTWIVLNFQGIRSQ